MNNIAQQIVDFAKAQGFDLVGFSDVKANEDGYKKFKSWVEDGNAADLSYMTEKERMSKRSSAKKLLNSATTVISLGMNYYHDQPKLARGSGRIARYAFGRDYHKVIKAQLKKIEKFIQEKFSADTISYVDTGPILERSFAVQSGLGFIGKNSCLITKEFGSWVLLGEVITSSQVRTQKTPTCKKNKFELHCGSCTRCITSCPTGAITKTGDSYQIDARKCLSYWTIEFKGPASKIPLKIHTAMKKTKRIFGCDICQEVCPHNCRATPSSHAEFTTQPIAGNSQNTEKILTIKSQKDFLKIFAGSPLTRAKLKGLKRNAKITSPDAEMTSV